MSVVGQEEQARNGNLNELVLKLQDAIGVAALHWIDARFIRD